MTNDLLNDTTNPTCQDILISTSGDESPIKKAVRELGESLLIATVLSEKLSELNGVPKKIVPSSQPSQLKP